MVPLGYPLPEEAAKVSPTGPAWVPQSHHEPLLLGRLREAPSATVRFGSQLRALNLGGDRVRVNVFDRSSGKERQVRRSTSLRVMARIVPCGVKWAS